MLVTKKSYFRENETCGIRQRRGSDHRDEANRSFSDDWSNDLREEVETRIENEERV